MTKKNKKKENKNRTKQIEENQQIKPIFQKRYQEMLKKEDEYNQFIETILRPQRKSIRINEIKIDTEEKKNELIKKLQKKGINLTKIPWTENGYFVEYNEEERTDLGNLLEHFLGEIYIQEATSMTPPLLLELPKKITKNFKILDMAASPGSKTTQIGGMLKNRGILIANEIDWKRLGPLKINLERSGLINVIITTYDGTKFPGHEEYERIILDAPCSGTGVIRKSPRTLKTYNPKKLKLITKTQKQLLKRAFELLKPEGILIYSTCSLEPEENELLIEEFLKTEKKAKLLPITLPGLKTRKPLETFFDKKISQNTAENTLRIWPHLNNTNGFFIAKIKKL